MKPPPLAILALAVALLLVSIWQAGAVGVGLFLAGILTTGLYLAGSWAAIKLLSTAIQGGAKPATSYINFLLAIALKVPFIVVIALAIRNLQFSWQCCFLLGLTLVYSWIVAWAIARANIHADADNGHS